jgi:subtilisin family serine protease
MARALSRLGSDVLVIAAAGNSGEGRRWPGAFGAVIDVSSARDDADPLTAAPPPSWVDALAPGTDVTSTYLFGEVVDDALPAATTFLGYAKWNGTSFATAFVSGAVAAAMTKYDLTAPEALKRLFDEPTVSKVAKHGD